jgi:alkanesulfonate monooxygenase SsuD/methylene tetrahydromethanopterin reductase-like flavin-dependent oxidoreductase (luciferase family)
MLEKLGVTVAWQGSTIEGLTAIASEADKLGFGYFWVPEAWGLEAFSTISHILSRTSSIHVGTGIANVYSRSAALIGMGCATFDQIAPGRFVLGLGSSGRAVIENWHGYDFSKPLGRTEEYVRVIRKVASGEDLEFHGDVLKNLSKFRLFTKAVESNLEIYLGAIGDMNLKLAGRICDGAILAEYPSSKLDHALKLVNGKRLFTYLPTYISASKEDLARANQQVAKNIAFYIASMGSYYSKNLVRLGYEDDVNRIVDAYARGGSKASTHAISEKMLDELSLVGPAESVIDRVSKFPKGVIPVLGFGARSFEEVTSAINSMRLYRRT